MARSGTRSVKTNEPLALVCAGLRDAAHPWRFLQGSTHPAQGSVRYAVGNDEDKKNRVHEMATSPTRVPTRTTQVGPQRDRRGNLRQGPNKGLLAHVWRRVRHCQNAPTLPRMAAISHPE